MHVPGTNYCFFVLVTQLSATLLPPYRWQAQQTTKHPLPCSFFTVRRFANQVGCHSKQTPPAKPSEEPG